MMKILLETLGPEAARRFLTFALPQLEIRSRELLDNLRVGDYEAAANCAHRLKGTVHLYTSPELQDMLHQIVIHDHTSSIDACFIDAIEEKLNNSINEINLFISSN